MFISGMEERTGVYNEDFCSVAIPSFNRHKRLKHLLNSIHKYADMPFEVIVNDEGGAIYSDFNFIKDVRDKVSHFAVNLGRNKGLHNNVNSAVSLTRSKYVILLYDDSEVIAPFMRETVKVLDHARYVGVIALAHRYKNNRHGYIHCKTDEDLHYGVCLGIGGTWAQAFRRDYWEEIGGYPEDCIYGDGEFMTKGYSKGYLACHLSGVPRANDTDKSPVDGHTEDSTAKFIKVCGVNYPKIFDPSNDNIRRVMDHNSRLRSEEIGKKTHVLQNTPFSEERFGDWQKHMETVTDGYTISWELLEKYHKRYIKDIKKDAILWTP